MAPLFIQFLSDYYHALYQVSGEPAASDPLFPLFFPLEGSVAM